MAYDKQIWVPYDESLTPLENIERGAVTTSERMNTIEQGIFDSEKQMFDFMSGKDILVTVKSDFKGKQSGSLAENPNSMYFSTQPNLLPPQPFQWLELTNVPGWRDYSNVAELDGRVFTNSNNVNGNMFQSRSSFNVLEIAKRNFKGIFDGLSEAEQVTKLKSIISKMDIPVWARGSGPSGNRATIRAFNHLGNEWGTTTSVNSTSQISKMSLNFTTASVGFVLSSKGIMDILLNAEASNGTVPSSIFVDYAELEATFKINIKDFFPNRIEYNKDIKDIKNAIIALGGTV